MKRPLIYIPLSFLAVAVMAAAVFAFCVPTYTTIPLAYLPCDEGGDHTIYKAERNYINFPDTASAFVDTEGFGGGPGGCQKNCDPDFLHPVTQEGLWFQFVDDEQVHEEDTSHYCHVVGERLYYAA